MSVTVVDIQRLAKDPSPVVRAELAGKIALDFARNSYAERESAIAADILRLLARDIEVNVRKALASALAPSMHAPRDLMLRLAADVTEVALPVLEFSYVLSEEDLVAIVKSTAELARLSAIARRDTLSASLSDALFSTGQKDVIELVVNNKGAHVEETLIEAHWDMLSSHPNLLEALVRRGGLSVPIAEKLFAHVSDALKHYLVDVYRLPFALVDAETEDVREWSMLSMMESEEGTAGDLADSEIESLVHQLYTSGRLTHSLVIRSLCVGDLTFFEASMARLASVPRANARILLFDGGPLGFQAVYSKSGMPDGFYEAIKALLHISLEITQFGRLRRGDFRKRVIERVQTERLDRSVENMSYLISLIGGPGGASEPLH